MCINDKVTLVELSLVTLSYKMKQDSQVHIIDISLVSLIQNHEYQRHVSFACCNDGSRNTIHCHKSLSPDANSRSRPTATACAKNFSPDANNRSGPSATANDSS